MAVAERTSALTASGLTALVPMLPAVVSVKIKVPVPGTDIVPVPVMPLLDVTVRVEFAAESVMVPLFVKPPVLKVEPVVEKVIVPLTAAAPL